MNARHRRLSHMPPPNGWVRPYVKVAGRTRADGRAQFPVLYTHTLVTGIAGDRHRAYLAGLLPEKRALYERSLQIVESVAELSAHCGVPLGVSRVLLADLAEEGRLRLNPETAPFDTSILERAIDGLRQYT